MPKGTLRTWWLRKWDGDPVRHMQKEKIVPFGADELAEFGNILGYGVNELGIFFDKNVPIEEQKG